MVNLRKYSLRNFRTELSSSFNIQSAAVKEDRSLSLVDKTVCKYKDV